jgi:hypothetical protein
MNNIRTFLYLTKVMILFFFFFLDLNVSGRKVSKRVTGQVFNLFSLLKGLAFVECLLRARIFKLLMSQRIDSIEPIPPGSVAWRWYDNPIPTHFLAPRDFFKNSSTDKQ